MSKKRSIHTRVLFLLLTQVLVALLAVAVVSAASEEPAQLPDAAVRTAGDASLLPNTFPVAESDPLAPLRPDADTTLSLTIVSAPWAVLDSNKPETEGPRVLVVEAAITNTGSTTATLPVITLDYNEDPANDWVLLPGEDPERKATELGPDEVYHAYWFATYTTTHEVSHVYTVTASAGNATPVSTSQNIFRPEATVETTRTLGGGSNRELESTSDIYVGVAFTATVRWDLGTNFQSVLLSPVGNLDFDPSSYRLVASKVTFFNNATPISTVDDRLYFPTVPATTTDAQGDFVFLALRPTETTICPYATPLYQKDFKYDKDYCTPGIPITGTVTLSMTKQVNASQVQQGQALTYTIAYTNNAPTPLGNVWFWDDVDPAIGSIITPTIDPPGDPDETTEQRAAWNVGDVAAAGEPGSTGTFTFTILVDGGGQDLADQTPIVNDAFFGIDLVELPAGAALTSTVTTTLQAPTIAVAKTDNLDIVKAGQALTYTLRITNSGSITATGVVITDLLPAGVSPGGGTSPSWPLAPIPPLGGFEVITIPLTVDAIVPDGSTLTNIVTATYQNEAGWAYDPKTATDDTTVSAPFWVLTKSDDPDPVKAGATLTYTLSYYHNGSTPAQDITLTDTLPAEVTYNGLVSQPPGWGTPVYEAGPPATLTWYTPTLAVGASGTMVFTVTVDSGASGSIINHATLYSTDPTTYTMTSEATSVQTSADLAVAKSDAPDPVLAGNTLTYTLQVTNTGPSDATGVTLTDTLPPEVSFVSADPGQGTFDETTMVWSAGDLASGDSASLTLVVTVDSGTTGTISNEAIVSGDQDDPDSANNTATEDTTVNTSADLAIAKSDDPDPVAAAGTLIYTLTYTNSGPSDAGTVFITDTLDSNTAFSAVISQPPAWTLLPPDPGAPNTRVWTADTLAAGTADEIVFAVTVDAATIGEVVNNATIASDTPDDDLTNNDAQERTAVGDPFRATIYGYVFADTNCNGIWDDGELPLADVPVDLDGPVSDSTTTRSDGFYFFITDQPGVYRVIETDLEGYFSTTPNEVHLAVELGHSYRIDFGDGQGTECAAIYGTVFEDANSNAIWDTTELGISDVTITLDDAATAATYDYGGYTFSVTVPGPHTVVETDPVGYMSTTPNEVTRNVLLGNGYQVDFGDVPFCTCPPDEYEEDDTWDQAKELPVGVAQTHDFCDDATDWTYFTVQRGFVYTITTSSWGQRADTVLGLYGPDGTTLLASSDDFEGTDDYSSLIVWQAPTDAQGEYYVRTTNRSDLIGCDTDYDVHIAQKAFYFYYLPLIHRQFTAVAPAAQTEAPAETEPAPASADTLEEPPQPEGEPAIEPEITLSPTGIITHTCPDLYEEDDTWELAKPIGDGELQVHSFDSPMAGWAADKDFVSFYIRSEQSITFTIPTVTGTQTLMELYDADGIPIPEHKTTADNLILTDLARGRYFLSVSPRLATHGCADVAGYELQADMSPVTVIYLPLLLRSWE